MLKHIFLQTSIKKCIFCSYIFFIAYMGIHKTILIIALFVFCFLTGKNHRIHGAYSPFHIVITEYKAGDNASDARHPASPAAQRESIDTKETTQHTIGISVDDEKFIRKQHLSVQTTYNDVNPVIHYNNYFDSFLLRDIRLPVHLRI